MFSRIITYCLIFGILNSLDAYSTNGENCISILQKHAGQLKCVKTAVVYTEQIWLDINQTCDRSSTSLSILGNLKIACHYISRCIVTNNRNYLNHIYMNIQFQCKQCLSVLSGYTATITCPASGVIGTYAIHYNKYACPALITLSRNQMNRKTDCENSFSCSIRTERRYRMIASIYFQCKGDSNQPDNDISMESYGRSSIPDEDISTDSPGRSSKPDKDITTESPGGPNYAARAGGIVGGVLLIICIIVGVFLLRRRNCTASGKENVMTNLNPTYDPNHGQTEPENYQQAHLMNSTDAIHVSTSHAVGVDNAANEVSNTYSHLRNTVDDIDAMYDHTIRHNVHDTCDSDYGIAHRRITEDDYDVSGTYRQFLSKEADPVYN